MAAQCARGKQLINEKNFEEAVVAFTAALKESPTSPVYIGLRAQAYQRNKQYTEALADANASVVYAHQRAKKELIIDAQVRRAVILYNMERYGDARAVLEVVGRMNKDVKEAATWSRMIEGKVATLGEDHESMRVTVKEIPDLDSEAATSGPATSSTVGAASASASASASTPAPAAQTPAEKIRHDWYQNNQNIYLTLLAKGVPQDKTQVDITERSMSISFPVAASNTTYDFSLDPLYASVKPENCITRILPTKVEIILAKATPGQKWHALESNEPVSESVTESASSNDEPVARAVFTSSAPSGPAYPTSSKSGPKNWDKLGDDDEEEEGDATNNFFKKLYQGASPEAQRAMMKSYTESNGTSLSTNWEEVSKGKVETLPPDGMEAKPWSK